MKKFKGKYAKGEEGDGYKKFAKKSFRKTGKRLQQFDPWTVFIPRYNRFKNWWDWLREMNEESNNTIKCK